MMLHKIKAGEYILDSWVEQHELYVLCCKEPFLRAWDMIMLMSVSSTWEPDAELTDDGKDGFYHSNLGMNGCWLS